MRISLAAFVGKEPAGFLMARVYYGEFGQPEAIAILDTIGVAPAFDLLGFFEHAGFGPAPVICLEKKVERPR